MSVRHFVPVSAFTILEARLPLFFLIQSDLKKEKDTVSSHLDLLPKGQSVKISASGKVAGNKGSHPWAVWEWRLSAANRFLLALGKMQQPNWAETHGTERVLVSWSVIRIQHLGRRVFFFLTSLLEFNYFTMVC